MKKLTLTAASTAILGLAIAATAAPSFAQNQPNTTTTPATKVAPAPTGTPAAQPPSIDQLKLTKDQQIKLSKLQQTVMQKKIAVLTPSQQQQVRTAMQQGKSPTLTLTVDQQNQLRAIQTAALAQQDAILTSEQKLKLQEINKQYAPQQK
ncbi:hypothetical protein [Chamaesiphon sp.]|uniref:hypothetical protein n=1 Tax=Chamaesiphon sp. TaxID=2814140 RepID=UPI0035941C38